MTAERFRAVLVATEPHSKRTMKRISMNEATVFPAILKMPAPSTDLREHPAPHDSDFGSKSLMWFIAKHWSLFRADF
jgi:hypothetical protein